jgi:hypothetical protein
MDFKQIKIEDMTFSKRIWLRYLRKSDCNAVPEFGEVVGLQRFTASANILRISGGIAFWHFEESKTRKSPSIKRPRSSTDRTEVS